MQWYDTMIWCGRSGRSAMRSWCVLRFSTRERAMSSKLRHNDLTEQNNGQRWPNNNNNSNKCNDLDNDNDRLITIWLAGVIIDNNRMISTAYYKNNIKDHKNVGTAEDYYLQAKKISKHGSGWKVRWPCQACVSRFSFSFSTASLTLHDLTRLYAPLFPSICVLPCRYNLVQFLEFSPLLSSLTPKQIFTFLLVFPFQFQLLFFCPLLSLLFLLSSKTLAMVPPLLHCSNSSSDNSSIHALDCISFVEVCHPWIFVSIHGWVGCFIMPFWPISSRLGPPLLDKLLWNYRLIP